MILLIYKTTNNGNNWFYVTTLGYSDLYDGQYLNDTIIICVGGESNIYYYNSVIWKSDNDGVGWTQVSSDLWYTAFSVHFINEKTGFVSGYNSYFKKSVNGGNSWFLGRIDSQYLEYHKIRFVDSLYGYSGTNNYISITTNGGQSFNLKSCPIAFNNFFPLTRNVIIGIGNYGNIFKSNDNGNNWVNLRVSSYPSRLGCICYVSDSLMIAGGTDGNIVKTTNGGKFWNQITTGINGFITSLYFVDNLLGFATTSRFYIYKTTNCGDNWNQIYSSTNYIENIHMLNANTGFICGRGHLVKKTTNCGIEWTDINIQTALTYFQDKIFRPTNWVFNSKIFLLEQIPLCSRQRTEVITGPVIPVRLTHKIFTL